MRALVLFLATVTYLSPALADDADYAERMTDPITTLAIGTELTLRETIYVHPNAVSASLPSQNVYAQTEGGLLVKIQSYTDGCSTVPPISQLHNAFKIRLSPADIIKLRE